MKKIFVAFLTICIPLQISFADPKGKSPYSDFEYRSLVFSKLLRDLFVPIRRDIEALRFDGAQTWIEYHNMWSPVEGQLLRHFLASNSEWPRSLGVKLIRDGNFDLAPTGYHHERRGLGFVIDAALAAERQLNGGSNPNYGKLKWLTGIEFRIPGGGEADAEGWSWVRYEPSSSLRVELPKPLSPLCQLFIARLSLRVAYE